MRPKEHISYPVNSLCNGLMIQSVIESNYLVCPILRNGHNYCERNVIPPFSRFLSKHQIETIQEHWKDSLFYTIDVKRNGILLKLSMTGFEPAKRPLCQLCHNHYCPSASHLDTFLSIQNYINRPLVRLNWDKLI